MVEIDFGCAVSTYVKGKIRKQKELKIKKSTLPQKVHLTSFLENVEKLTPDCVLLKLVPPFFKKHLHIEEFPWVFSRLYSDDYSKLSREKLTTIGKNLRYSLKAVSYTHLTLPTIYSV